MIHLETVPLPSGEIQIAQAEPEDIDAILAVFDGAVAWMNAQGNTKQWGSEPFSAKPHIVERFRRHLQKDQVFVAVKTGGIVGAIVITFAPPSYCWQETKEQAAYIEPFATAPEVRGEGIGSALLEKAETYACEQGFSLLRLDCFAEIPKLPAYYEQAGFEPKGEFLVGDWHGRMYEKPLPER